jgi:hypothetical protein
VAPAPIPEPEPSPPPPVPRVEPPRKPTVPLTEEAADPEQKARKRKLLIIAAGVVLFLGVYYYIFLAGPAGPVKRTTYPVEGMVRYKGVHPVVKADVLLIPLEATKDQFVPKGTTDDKGNFKLSTYSPDDGAPEGKYKVIVRWFPPPTESGEPAVPGGATAPSESGIGLGTVRAKSKVGLVVQENVLLKYNDPETSGLTAEIKPEPNKLKTFELE